MQVESFSHKTQQKRNCLKKQTAKVTKICVDDG